MKDIYFKKFIEDCNIIFENKYDYSKSIYITSKISIKIICPLHGEFNKRPDVHKIRKSGCPICVKEKRKNNPKSCN